MFETFLLDSLIRITLTRWSEETISLAVLVVILVLLRIRLMGKRQTLALSQGWLENGEIVCPYHGWAFNTAGACTRIPQQDDDMPIPPRARTLNILIAERYGLVWICAGMPLADIPDLPEAEDPSFTLLHELMEVWTTSAPRVIDNADAHTL